ncbi:nucleotidyltransferase domain-containing protein [Burkholderia cenocepacia]|uniref:GSU2403 family nucleotidyltransferase fold protein n=1 Tax=Burkholderia cenocepacia TaxID=95486 RepID=UPI0007617A31|nr:nucleotidyltransferase domain-containing protein [Burkholderia cenocepacia]KWU26405.1 hypothetical protein AS149_25800 [Burkholderia cenocepacia]
MNQPTHLKLYGELSLGAQTAYAELSEQTRAFEMNRLAGLKGTFYQKERNGRQYTYFSYRDIDGKMRAAYVGPTDARISALVTEFEAVKDPKKLAPVSRAAIELGCGTILPKHFRIIKQLGDYGFYQAGGILIGTHAFVAMGNMLGVKWTEANHTLDVDFAHAGKNVSVALPVDMKLSVHDALTSLEMGLLPMNQMSHAGGQYRNPADPELRLDFVTSQGRNEDPVRMDNLGLTLAPLRFMEYSLEGITQAAVLSREGSVIVNIPAPERYAVHKLIVYGLRTGTDRVKSRKDVVQAAALAQWHADNGQGEVFNAAWRDAIGRGKSWKKHAETGRDALLQRYPALNVPDLWAAEDVK